MKKFIYFIVVTIVLLLLLELSAICISAYSYVKAGRNFNIEDIKYNLTPILYERITDVSTCQDDDSFCLNDIRPIAGKEYNNSPITVFGCSYAYGHYLKNNQIFSYKLSKIVEHPVYNRAFPGKGLSNMYFQVSDEKFYKIVPPSDYIIFLMIDDHYRRVLSVNFDPFEYWQVYNYKYDKKQDKLILTNYLPLNRILYNSYLYRLIKAFQINKYVNNPKNAEELTDFVLAHFVKSKEELEKHWNKKVNFIIVLYDDVKYSDLLKEKLEKNGFIVVNVPSLTDEDLGSTRYMMQDNWHPTEAAWDLLTPLIVEDLGKKGIKL